MATDASCSKNDTSRVKTVYGLVLGGIGVTVAYIIMKKFYVTSVEFATIMTYLLLMLLVLSSTDPTRPIKNTEAFQDDTTSCTLPSGLSDDSSADTGAQKLYELPEKVKNMIVPGLQKIADSFSGKGDEEDDDGGGGGSFKALNRENMGMEKFSPVCGKEEEVKGKCPDPEEQRTAFELKSLDYFLCRVKHADKERYTKLLNL